MRHLVLLIAAAGIGCAPRPAEQRERPGPVGSSPATTAVEAAAKFALTTYVGESTRAEGIVCLELDGTQDATGPLRWIGREAFVGHQRRSRWPEGSERHQVLDAPLSSEPLRWGVQRTQRGHE